MKQVSIERFLCNKYGTFSRLSIDGLVMGNMLEPVFPIPAGSYTAKYSFHPIHKWVYELQGVPNHTGILIHIGNTLKDTKGCLLPGKSISKVWLFPFKWVMGVVKSRVAFEQLMTAAGKEDLTVTIKDVENESILSS